MASPSMDIKRHPAGPLRLLATVAVLAAAAFVAPAASSANNHKADGVRAKVKQGTLEVSGSRGNDAVVLRLKAGDLNRVEVDVGNDGSADFSFRRQNVKRLAVRAGDG